jgi:hypothetical protein
MSPPIVVQGTPVGNPNSYAGASAPTAYTDQDTPVSATFTGKGEKQQSKCRDPIFALVRYPL